MATQTQALCAKKMTDTLQVVPLFSGSSGNSVLVVCGPHKYLVDVGCSCKRVTQALDSVGVRPEELDAVLITHDHIDHIRGVDVFTRRYGCPIYACEATFFGIYAIAQKPHEPSLDHIISPGAMLDFGAVSVRVFETPHDASVSVGYRFEYQGRALGLVTDLGHFSDTVCQAASGCELVYIEANYDRQMLWSGAYPWPLKRRVDGLFGHLCNEDCADAVARLYKTGTRHFMLGHLSLENNTPMTAREQIIRSMAEDNLVCGKDYYLSVAKRLCPTEAMIVGEDIK